MSIKISITGPESTGKTWLSKELSLHYGCRIVNEYSREFFSDKDYVYTIMDLDHILRGQINNEQKLEIEGNDLLICDTDVLSVKIWAEIVFGKTTRYIDSMMTENTYDLYLLCNLDVEWTPDRFRKNKQNRQYIFNKFVEEMNTYNLNYKLITSTGRTRLQNAIRSIDDFLNGRQ